MLTNRSKATLYSHLTIGLILVAFVLRIYQLDFQSLWRDEVDALRFSDASFLSLDSYQIIFRILTQPGHNGPLYFIFLRAWRSLTGDSEFALRYFSLVAGVLMVALTYRLARQFKLPASVGPLAASLVATSPYLIWYSQEVKMYTWLACTILIAIYAYQAALTAEKPGSWWVLFVVVTSLSFYIHILAPLMVIVYFLWALIAWPRLKSRWSGWLGAMALLTLPYSPLLLWQMPLLLNGYDSGHPFYPFLRQISLLLHFYSAGILRLWFGVYAISLTAFLALVGLMGGFWTTKMAGRPVQARQCLQIGLWFAGPLLLVYFISLRVTVFEDRYLIYILPAYYLLMAIGLVIVAARVRLLAGVLLLLVLAFNARAGWLQASQPIKTDFRAAAHHIAHGPSNEGGTGSAGQIKLRSEAPRTGLFTYYLPLIYGSDVPPTIMFQMPYLQHTFDYYFDRPYRPLDGIWTNDNRDPAQVAQEMAALTGDLQKLWLVAAEEAYWDQRYLVREWLNTHAVLIDEEHFVGVDVYLYRLHNEDPL